MKKLYFLDEEEKNRILNIHESATKRQYLSEQAVTSGWSPDPTGNKTWEYQFKDNSWFARKKGTTQEYNISVDKKYARSVGYLNNAYPEAIKTTMSSKDKTKKVQQIVSQTENNTRAIQKLLNLKQTGIMDTTLLQNISKMLNGGGQQVQPTQQTTPTSITPAAGTTTPPLANTSSQLNLTDDQITQTMDKLLNKPQ
jgi:hypothetical protein